MGERTPHLDPECRGVFFGLSASHKRENLIRAVMEGVAFSLRDCQNVLSEMGIPLGNIAVCGGGAKSKLWSHILSDVCDIPLYTLINTDGAAFGACILAGVGVGTFVSVEEACAEWILRDKVFMPDKKNNKKYNEVYGLYRELYPALKSSFKRLGSMNV
jgi:xylulokinase